MGSSGGWAGLIGYQGGPIRLLYRGRTQRVRRGQYPRPYACVYKATYWGTGVFVGYVVKFFLRPVVGFVHRAWNFEGLGPQGRTLGPCVIFFVGRSTSFFVFEGGTNAVD